MGDIGGNLHKCSADRENRNLPAVGPAPMIFCAAYTLYQSGRNKPLHQWFFDELECKEARAQIKELRQKLRE